jgi:hypothetical protein
MAAPVKYRSFAIKKAAKTPNAKPASVMLLADRPQRANCRAAAVTGRRISAVA